VQLEGQHGSRETNLETMLSVSFVLNPSASEESESLGAGPGTCGLETCVSSAGWVAGHQY
jgi:hypothetical protein